MKTFAQFREAVAARAFPEGEAEPLVANHTRDVVSALLDLQHWIPRLRSKHISTYRSCSAYFSCGATVVPAPRGKIRSVYTLPAGAPCCPIFYDYIESFDKFIGWLIQSRKSWTNPTNPSNLPALPSGMYYASSVTDKGRR